MVRKTINHSHNDAWLVVILVVHHFEKVGWH